MPNTSISYARKDGAVLQTPALGTAGREGTFPPKLPLLSLLPLRPYPLPQASAGRPGATSHQCPDMSAKKPIPF